MKPKESCILYHPIDGKDRVWVLKSEFDAALARAENAEMEKINALQESQQEHKNALYQLARNAQFAMALEEILSKHTNVSHYIAKRALEENK
jgi:hypothetical protein